MSTVSNEVFGEPFEVVELANAINRIPYKEGLILSLFDWNVVRSPTTGVRINSQNGSIRVVPSTPRGGVPPVRHGDKRNAATVDIPGYSERATIQNREALNVAAGLEGEQRLMTLEMLRDERLALINGDLDVTDEHQAAMAVKGKILDINGKELVDLYDLMGVEQLEFDIDLTSSKDLAIQIEEIKEFSETAMGGTPIDHFKLIAGKNASVAFSASESYREAMSNPMSRILSKEDGRKGIRINDDVDIVHYRSGYFDADDAYLVPVFPGAAQCVYGPHEAEEYWGNILPRYVTREPLPHGQGVEIDAWTYVLRYFERPEAILKLNILGGKTGAKPKS